MDERQKKILRLQAAILWNRPSGVTKIHVSREFHHDAFLREVVVELVRIISVKSIMNEPPTALETFAMLILDNHIGYQTHGFTLADVLNGKADEYLKEFRGLDLGD